MIKLFTWIKKWFHRTFPHSYTVLNERGDLHKVNGPAVCWDNIDYFWYLNGKPHRYYGPYRGQHIISIRRFPWFIHGRWIR